MRELWRKTVNLAGTGFILGMWVGLGFLSITDIGTYYIQNGADGLALYLALSGLLGAVGMGGMTIYSLEQWSLLRCTVTHSIITLSTYCAVGFTLGWLDLRDRTTLFMFLGYVIAYCIIWLAMHLKYKRQIRQINEALRTWKAHQSADAEALSVARAGEGG